MKKGFKRFTAAILTLALLLTMAVGAGAASVYSVRVQDKNVQFLIGGQAVSTYPAKSADLTLMTDGDGDFLVCFYKTNGKYTGITLGGQSSLTITGAVNSLTVDKSLKSSVKIILGSTAKVSTLTVNGSNKVSLTSGASVTAAKLNSTGAAIYAPSGSSVKTVTAKSKNAAAGAGIGTFKVGGQTVNSDSGSSGSVQSGKLKLNTQTVVASPGDTLEELEDQLNSNISAYYNLRMVAGHATWTNSGGTTVKKTGSYSFNFKPEQSKYGSARGTIKVLVSGEGSSSGDGSFSVAGYEVNIKPINADSGAKLSSLYSKLNSSITVYDDRDRKVRGTAEWTASDSTRVTETDTYRFLFTPDDDDYDEFKTEIKIIVDGEDEDGNYDTGDYKVKITPLSAVSGTKLSALSSKLKESIRVYDDDGKRITGTPSWVDSTSTTVKSSDTLEFKFKPTSSRYDSFTAEIKVTVDDNGSADTGEYEVRFYPIDTSKGTKLSKLTSELSENIRVYDEDGERIGGECEWVLSSSTKVNSTGFYQFRFLPDRSSKYDSFKGQIKINVKGSNGSSSTSDDGVELKVTALSTTKNTKLSALLSKLNSNVRAYDEDGDKISGECVWVNSGSTRVTENETFDFKFIPNSSSYDTIRGEIRVNIGGSSGSGSPDGLELEVSPIYLSTAQARLSDLTEDLKDCVRAYDEDGDRVTGTVKWAVSTSTQVKRDGDYKFTFTPKSGSGYSKVTGTVSIYVD